MVRVHVGTPDCTCTGARDTGRTWHSLQQYAVRLHLEQSSSLCSGLRQSLLSQGRSESAHSAPAAATASPVFDMTASLQRMAARAAASPTQEAGLLSLCLAREPSSQPRPPRVSPAKIDPESRVEGQVNSRKKSRFSSAFETRSFKSLFKSGAPNEPHSHAGIWHRAPGHCLPAVVRLEVPRMGPSDLRKAGGRAPPALSSPWVLYCKRKGL